MTSKCPTQPLLQSHHDDHTILSNENYYFIFPFHVGGSQYSIALSRAFVLKGTSAGSGSSRKIILFISFVQEVRIISRHLPVHLTCLKAHRMEAAHQGKKPFFSLLMVNQTKVQNQLYKPSKQRMLS